MNKKLFLIVLVIAAALAVLFGQYCDKIDKKQEDSRAEYRETVSKSVDEMAPSLSLRRRILGDSDWDAGGPTISPSTSDVDTSAHKPVDKLLEKIKGGKEGSRKADEEVPLFFKYDANTGLAELKPENITLIAEGEEILQIMGEKHNIFAYEFAPGRFVIVVEPKKKKGGVKIPQPKINFGHSLPIYEDEKKEVVKPIEFPSEWGDGELEFNTQ